MVLNYDIGKWAEGAVTFFSKNRRKRDTAFSLLSNKLFAQPFDERKAATLDQTPELAETLEAFVGRFCRLQDTVGDKMLLAWLKAVQEKHSTFIDNLDKAENLSLLPSADQWIQLRINRNKIIHEYIENAAELADAINLAKEGIAC
jgi:hypothetical protein